MAESVVILDPKVLFANTSSQNQCQDSFLWREWYPRARTGVLATFVLYIVAVAPALFLISRHRFKSSSGILAWYTYPAAILTTLTWSLLALVDDIYLNCLKISALRYLQIFSAVNYFRYIGSMIMLGIIMISIPVNIMRQSGTNSRNTRIAHTTLLLVVIVFGLIHVSIWNLDSTHLLQSLDMVPAGTANSIGGAYCLLHLCASIAAGARIIFSIWTVRRKGLSTGGLFPFGIALVVCQVAFVLIDVIAFFGIKVENRPYPTSAAAAFGVLSLFFQACVFTLVCLVAQSKTFERGRLRSVDEDPARERRGAVRVPRWSRKFSI